MRNDFSTSGLARLANLARDTLAEASKVSAPAPPHEKEVEAKTEPVLPALPFWCSRSCPCLDVIALPDGLVAGCVQETADWQEEWRRLSKLASCPLKTNKKEVRHALPGNNP